ncbi:MAG: hypothetical protein BV457_03910 [Thermoplasmata archaeon M9B1D]|nr:MAG: hypothetical protein BV457_03910 [Thermoplasmata archaeon M9B1D]PNX50156.1 MAG: hypothetical protein BV456_07635 [Thermoplasmata archaeon M8B2D]
MKKILPIIIIGILFLSGIEANALSLKKTNKQSTNFEEYDMVVIAPDVFSASIQTLIDHKNSHGVKTFLKTTEDIYTKYNGQDDAEKIKLFIKNAIEANGIQYVLLLGGHKGQSFSWYIPVRIVHLADGARYTEYVSDLYYADIYQEDGSFEDWNSNGDDIIGEWGKDSFDLKPDIALGRLPCRTTKEVVTIINKIIEYETMSFNESWFHQMLVTGGDSIPNSGAPFPYEGEAVCDKAIEIMKSFSVRKLFVSDMSLVDSSDFITAWNQGLGFAFYSGRAGPSSLLTYDINGNSVTPFHVKQINKLQNKGKYPIFIIQGCLSGKFDVTIFNVIKWLLKQPNIQFSDIAFDCIGWDMVKLQDSGAIAAIAPTSQCWVNTGDNNNNNIPDIIESVSGFLALEFLRAYADEGFTTLGTMYMKAIQNYVFIFPVHSDKIDCKTIQEFSLIGDPSLKIGGYAI